MIDDGGEWWFKKSMNVKLFSFITALLILGCGESQVDPIVDHIEEIRKPQEPKDPFANAIDLDKLQKRGLEGEEILYLPNSYTPYTGKVIGSRDPSANPLELINYKDGKKNGLATKRYDNGQKEYERHYKDGERHGLWTKWYENGQKRGKENYKDGKADGLASLWYENGLVKFLAQVKDGKFDGLSSLWYENGQKHRELNYKDGKKDGLWTTWYENGQKSSETNFKDGKLDGLWTEWNENGQKVDETYYRGGVKVED